MLIAYAENKREFEAQAQCIALGYACQVPRQVDLIRQAKRRFPDVMVTPFLPNYLFIDGDDDAYHAMKAVKEIRATITWVGQNEARLVQAFIDRVERDFAARMEQINAGQRVSEYEPGDLLTLMTGPFAGQLARFRRIVERQDDRFPMVEAVLDVQFFGKPIVAVVDPINARRSSA